MCVAGLAVSAEMSLFTESSGRRLCNLTLGFCMAKGLLLELRLVRLRLLESRLVRLRLLEMRLARANLLELRFARLAKRKTSRASLAKRKTSRTSLAKRKTDRTSLAKRKTDRASLGKRKTGKGLPRQTQKRQKPGGLLENSNVEMSRIGIGHRRIGHRRLMLFQQIRPREARFCQGLERKTLFHFLPHCDSPCADLMQSVYFCADCAILHMLCNFAHHVKERY